MPENDMGTMSERLALLERILEQLGEGVAVADLDGTLRFANHRWAELHGYAPEELIGKNLSIGHTAEQLKEDVIPFNEAVMRDGVHTGDVGHVRRDGTEFPTRMTTTLLRDDSGEPAGIIGIMADLTEQRRAEKELERTESVMTNLLDTMLEVVIYYNKDLQIVWANKAAGDTLDLMSEELSGHFCHKIWYGLDKPCEDCPVRKVIDTGVAHHADFETPDGRVWFIRAYPIHDEAGAVTGAVEFALDITERMRADKEMRRALARFEAVINFTPMVAVQSFDRSGVLQLWNPACETLYGFTAAEAVGRTVQELLLTNDPEREEFERLVGRMWDTGKGTDLTEWNVRTRDGSDHWVLSTMFPMFDDTGAVSEIFCMDVDITERRRAERALRESEERYRLLAEGAHDAIFIINSDFHVDYVNEYAARMLARAPEDLFDRPLRDLFPMENAQLMKTNLENVFETGEASYHENAITFNDLRIWLGTQLAPLTDDLGRVKAILGVSRDITERRKAENEMRDAVERLQATVNALPDLMFEMDYDSRIISYHAPMPENLYVPPDQFIERRMCDVLPPDTAALIEAALRNVESTGQKTIVEYSLPMPDGLQYFEACIAPKGVPGHPDAHVIALVRDVTERKQLDQAKINFLGSISHELRTPLSLILGYSEMLLKEDLPHAARKKIQIIHERGRHELKLVEELITLARFESGETRFDMRDVSVWNFLNKYLSEARVMVAGLVEKRYRTGRFTLRKDISTALQGVMVRCDEQRIRQVLDNLLENAVKYSDKDRLEFHVSAVLINGNVSISVGDSGIGIEPEHQENIFKPFFQVRKGRHPISDGMGKGLSIVRDFVQEHGGSVWVESEPGQGTTFTFTLPVLDIIESPEVKTVQRILVVDDDRDFVDFVESLLMAEGFEVHAAFNERGLFDWLTHETPDLILLDIQMPDGNGMDICYRLKNDPELKEIHIYFISAKLPNELRAIAREAGADGYMSKPFEIDAFLDMINKLQKT